MKKPLVFMTLLLALGTSLAASADSPAQLFHGLECTWTVTESIAAPKGDYAIRIHYAAPASLEDLASIQGQKGMTASLVEAGETSEDPWVAFWHVAETGEYAFLLSSSTSAHPISEGNIRVVKGAIEADVRDYFGNTIAAKAPCKQIP